MFTVHIFDHKNIEKFKKPYLLSSVENLVNEYRHDKSVAFISAANSLLFMDGGSDLGYMNSIQNICPYVKHCAKSLNLLSNNNRYHLPIGSAQLVIPEGTYKFISSPSMLLPQDVSMTNNPYHCLKTALNVAYNYNKYCTEDMKIKTIFTPFMCTGFGKFSFKKSYKLMKKAIKDYSNNEDYNFIVKSNNIYYSVYNGSILYDIVQEQPKIYENIEFGITVQQVLENKHG